MADNKISFEVQSLADAFGKTVFRTPEDVLRELLTNAQDACIIRAAQDPTYLDPLITVSVVGQVLTVRDNGLGMTEDHLRKYFATLGASSSRSLKRPDPQSPSAEVIGMYGLGTISYFIVADQIEVVTRSVEPGAPGIRWIYRGGESYDIESVADAPVGTAVSLRLKARYAEMSEKRYLLESMKRIAPHLDIPLSFEGELIPGTRRGAKAGPSETKAVTPVGRDLGIEQERSAEPISTPLAILRLEVKDSWSVVHFSTLLTDLQFAYSRLSAFLIYSEDDSQLLKMAFRPYIRTLMPNDRSAEFEFVLRTARSRVVDLRVHRIQIASPGFIELIGSLNPIRTIADFITNWRGENTKRQELTLAHKRALADRAAEIIKAAPNEDFADRFLKFALEEPNEKLVIIARDFRFEDSSWKKLDEHKEDRQSSKSEDGQKS